MSAPAEIPAVYAHSPLSAWWHAAGILWCAALSIALEGMCVWGRP